MICNCSLIEIVLFRECGGLLLRGGYSQKVRLKYIKKQMLSISFKLH